MSAHSFGRPATPARTGVWIGIGAIVMSFGAYTSALVVRQGAAPDWHHLVLPRLLYLNTLLLLASSGTLERGRRELSSLWAGGPFADARGVSWLWGTLALGLLFIAGQVVAWRQLAGQGLFLATNPNSAFFYVLTALHALHLLGGVIALGYMIRRVRATPGQSTAAALDAVSLYWHFMGVLWLYLLLLLALRL